MDNNKKFLITGASGWFGKTALSEYKKLYGYESFFNDILAFSSKSKEIKLEGINENYKVYPLKNITGQKKPLGILHMAFLTREKIDKYGIEKYIKINQEILETLKNFILIYPDVPIISISSGAADITSNKKIDKYLDPYAYLKKREETILKEHSDNRMSLVFRVYAATGEFLNRPEGFALGEFLRAAKNKNTIKVRSKNQVFRSYVSVETLMSLCWQILKKPIKNGFYNIDACYEDISILDLAKYISKEWNLGNPIYEECLNLDPEIYCGDKVQFKKLLKKYKIIHPSMHEQILITSRSKYI